MKVDESIVNFAVYEDGTEFLGMAEATLPEISRITAEINGAGINGTYNAPIVGHLEAMSLTLNFKTSSKAQYSLYENRVHTLDLRVAQQQRNPSTGEINTVSVKHVLGVTPVKLSPGKVAPASTADGSGEYSVSYYATYIDGTKVMEIDLLNFICLINGVDELADVRKALGK
ncbi:MAG: phage major tail tube protein [Clostridia bacterium]|jgi:P2 family phage contractile tail tube protein|nr:phage major tail tube protein [Clostridia bacterium]